MAIQWEQWQDDNGCSCYLLCNEISEIGRDDDDVPTYAVILLFVAVWKDDHWLDVSSAVIPDGSRVQLTPLRLFTLLAEAPDPKV